MTTSTDHGDNHPGEPVERPREVPGRSTGSWAAPTEHLHVGAIPQEAINLNVNGRHLTGPIRGFGQLWQKTYRARLSGGKATPEQVIQVWKDNFPKFWPKGNQFYGSPAGIAPGEVALLNLAGPGGITAPGGRPLISTGVMVIYADEESFSFMTPEGHMFAGMITFSAFEEDGEIVAQTQALVRANDPIYEMSFRLGFGHSAEDKFWAQTLENLGAYFGVKAVVNQTVVCVDPTVQWSQAKNIWHNAAVRTGFYIMLAPIRWVRGIFTRKNA
jgi:hypothetical protein